MKWFKFLIEMEKKPRRGLLAVEWIVLGYLVLTLLLMLFMWTRIVNPQAMISMRLEAVAITAAMWLVYRLVPCRLVLLLRIGAQLGLLSL